MADKVDKAKKKAKPKKDEKGVLAALPSTRPERIGGRRAATTGTATASKPAPSSTATSAAAATRSSSAAKPARAKPKRAAAKRASRPTAARRKAAAPRTFEPTQAAEAAAGAADERAAGAVPRAETAAESGHTYPRPQPVREGAPGIGTGGYRDESSPESARPSGVELATTAVRAAGEVAQLGLTVGGEVLKRVVRRLPRP